MTIDEAIKRCEEVAEENEKNAEIHDSLARNLKSTYEKLTSAKFCTNFAERAAEHRQLAEWLRDLKEAKVLMKKMILDIYHKCSCDNSDCDICAKVNCDYDDRFIYRYKDEIFRIIDKE